MMQILCTESQISLLLLKTYFNLNIFKSSRQVLNKLADILIKNCHDLALKVFFFLHITEFSGHQYPKNSFKISLCFKVFEGLLSLNICCVKILKRRRGRRTYKNYKTIKGDWSGL